MTKKKAAKKTTKKAKPKTAKTRPYTVYEVWKFSAACKWAFDEEFNIKAKANARKKAIVDMDPWDDWDTVAAHVQAIKFPATTYVVLDEDD